MNVSIYIHIPFCKSRCVYCGFYSSTLSELREAYVDALCHELTLRMDYLPAGGEVHTLYIGGGTPSQLSEGQLSRLMSFIYNKVGTPLEVTIECNPDDVTDEFARHLCQCGVNRVSMGAQTFDDDRLRFLGRRHDAAQVAAAMQSLRKEGIGNISIDLMFGFPGQTLEEWTADIRQAIALSPEHISAYSLMYEEGTPLYSMLERGQVKEIDEELSRKMYDTLCGMLYDAGYEHYEISNFALKGYRSRHNSGYWNGTPYLGLGAAAHSFDGESRQWNVSDVRQYIASIQRDEIPCERETLDASTKYNDLIVTALRTCDGIDMNRLTEDLGVEYRDYLLKNAQKNVALGLLVIEDDHIRLTRKGLYVSDMVMEELIF
ncbi:MAG: radical SAM family heme chaperone HemW [Prevotella sp.]|nr:radical SAM family heme chaperone HemW [Prevotella sp.]